ncbi:MAG: hypothetical protein ACPGJV_01880 [Bacteriovoracaceae bacterium]
MESIHADRLIESYKQDKLGHFYILNVYQTSKAPEQIQSFIETLYQSITNRETSFTQFFDDNKEENQELFHSDFTFFNTQDKTYSVESDEIIDFFRTLEFRPQELKKRFFIFIDAHKLSDSILNKMLKSLEEPPSWCCFLFFSSSESGFLQTIESRAVKLQLPRPKMFEATQTQGFDHWYGQNINYYAQNISPELIDDLKTSITRALKNDPWKLFELFKSNKQMEGLFFKLFLEFVNFKPLEKHDKLKIDQTVRNYERAVKFHHSVQGRVSLLITTMQRAIYAK